MDMLTRPLGYAVAHFGRLTLTSLDYATCEPECECGDREAYYLNDSKQRKALLARHGHDATELVIHWKDESQMDGDEQRDAAAELMADYHNSRGVRR